jgi:EAL domain-containing protein (putative c-di-GMP-specific phosphodiesterase class I)
LQQLKTADGYSTPTVFVLDLSLGKSDGIEVLDRLQALKYKGKVLLISGRDAAVLFEIERMGLTRGLRMLPSLQKPFQLDDLSNRLNVEIEPSKASPAEPRISPSTSALNRVVANGSLVLRYQARFDFKSQSVRGAEVLIYEQQPSGNLIPLTTSFEPSQAAVYHPLSRLLIRTLTREYIRHFSALETPPRLFITLPLSVVAESAFIALVREHFSPHGQFPGLVIHANDWKHFNNVKIVRETSARLKLYGIGLSIDDVGVLYSAIAGSQACPFEEFRLTPDYVSNCALNETKKNVCRDVINLAHVVGPKVCALGVMNSDELKTLIDLECDIAQGAVFGEPQPLEAFKTKHLGLSTSQMANSTPNADVDTGSLEWPAAGP